MSKIKIKFKIVTPEKIAYEDEIDQVTVPTEDGEITILGRHAPLVSILKPGEMIIKKDKETIFLAVSTGFIEVQPESQVYILADTAERAEEIDLKKAEEARLRAKKLLEEKQDMADIDFARLQAVLNREMIRLKVAQKYRKINK
ncbi:MAG: ATP synthase F1 subunit epsilon [Patescibacteria group bacterium]|nr:ATP synthase F1 subunit epsilon [Patescibacteria group bacterium]MDD5173150.1 ATP synthase F1 subunit epsilon [Patescibacteria group bacterium]